jgi:branched-chain amino acid transport system permease protein
VGVLIGVPALRVKGIYLGMATLSVGFIVEEVFTRWEFVTGGNKGRQDGASAAVRLELESSERCSTSVPGGHRDVHAGHPEPAAFAHRAGLRGDPRLGGLRAEHGHPPGALQDHLVCPVGRLTGIGGALYAHKLTVHLARPVQHLQSIDLLLLIVVGGLGSVCMVPSWAPFS